MSFFGFTEGIPQFIRDHPYPIGVATALGAIFLSAVYIYKRRRSKGCLDPTEFKEFRLIKKTQISPDTARFKFALPTPTSVLGLPVGQHVLCKGKDSDGEDAVSPYTPITGDSDLGYFELVVKMYPGGRMSRNFMELREGDYLPVKGPKGTYNYKPGQVRAFGMIAGGSGITPMFQIIRAILKNPKDKTKVHLIYGNRTANDILLKEDLDGFAEQFPNRFTVYYVVSEPSGKWSGGVGYVTKDIIRAHCPPPAFDIQILTCGPPAMAKVVTAHLNELGYTEDMQIDFNRDGIFYLLF
ncbi:hypothetical protein ACJRO7_028684 [Eucalyptus globulus]|uniref:NADH-cytochrome b5 reductase n=1 Tax=Eucalyptus globulus TaxID=34317 RepID=A0ABD3K289_EUCGL